MDTASLLVLPTMGQINDKTPQQYLLGWYAWLQSERGMRAELRRAEDPAAIMLCAGFRQLAKPLRVWLGEVEWRWLGLALVAGALAHAKAHDGRASFAAQLGQKGQGDKPRLSPMRFARLQQAHEVDEFYRLLLRALRQIDNQANLLSLADSILLWCREQDEESQEQGLARNPFLRPQLRWATEYFQANEKIEE